jgi:hypothetical protein
MEAVLYTIGHSVALVVEAIAIVVIAIVTRATLRDVRPQAG